MVLVHTVVHAAQQCPCGRGNNIGWVGPSLLGSQTGIRRVSGSRIPYLQSRNGVYHLRMRVPDDVRSRLGLLEVRRSLGDCSFRRAKLLTVIFAERVREAFEMIQKLELDQSSARALVRRCFEDRKREAEDRGGYVATSNEPDREIEDQRAMARERLATLEAVAAAPQRCTEIEAIADLYLANEFPQMAKLPEGRRADLIGGIARALAEEQRLFLFRLQDRIAPYLPTDTLFAGQSGVQLTSQGESAGEWQLTEQSPMASLPMVGPTVGAAVDEYLAAGTKRWVGKTLSARRWQLGYLVDFFGSATPVTAVTSHDVRAYRDGILKLRANHGRSPIQSFAEKQTENEAKRLAPKSAELIYQPCKAFFRWAKSEQGMIVINPAEDVRMSSLLKGKSVKRRRPFTGAELEQLFSSPTFTGSKSKNRRYDPGSTLVWDYKFWVPILGFYTGARLGELIQLHVSDAHVEGDIPFISINDEKLAGSDTSHQKHVKSLAGVRLVPLHPDVMALGFAEFVSKRSAREEVSPDFSGMSLRQRRSSIDSRIEVVWTADGQCRADRSRPGFP